MSDVGASARDSWPILLATMASPSTVRSLPVAATVCATSSMGPDDSGIFAKHAALYSANSEHLSQSTACSAPADAGVISDKLEKGSCDVPPDLQSYACLQTTNNQI
eukprot:CAMPEP_0114274972 /NCGR_PEP_ID=MMETSP0058-20121206/30069_1 /TAXON_ID=36894 /ORGANISM="Pyramimonas parkeae, CCMP726" /LENGTH=105 /DNA_ID=CAMNT_0001394837 /DNA_START=765 /DNA_END=1082 /DNA_ORIENTATION=+